MTRSMPIVRYALNLALTLTAGILVVATMAFTAVAAAWISFGMAIGFAVISMLMLAIRPTLAQRLVGYPAAALSGWLIIASLVFAPATVVWLGFGAAVALVVLGVSGLTAHELTTERVVHSLEVTRAPAPAERERQLA